MNGTFFSGPETIQNLWKGTKHPKSSPQPWRAIRCRISVLISPRGSYWRWIERWFFRHANRAPESRLQVLNHTMMLNTYYIMIITHTHKQMIKHVKAYEKQHFYFLFYNHDHTMMGIATIIIIWLVVSTPLKHISQMGVLFPKKIWKNKSHVPNHQPAMVLQCISHIQHVFNLTISSTAGLLQLAFLDNVSCSICLASSWKKKVKIWRILRVVNW